MNKRQAEVVTDMLQEGFIDEALVLARHFSGPSQEVTVAEKTADSKLGIAIDLIYRLFQFALIGAAVAKLAKLVIPPDIKVKIKGVTANISAILVAFAGILAPLILYMLLVASARAQRERDKDAWEQAHFYQNRARDNLDSLRKQMDRVMRA